MSDNVVVGIATGTATKFSKDNLPPANDIFWARARGGGNISGNSIETQEIILKFMAKFGHNPVIDVAYKNHDFYNVINCKNCNISIKNQIHVQYGLYIYIVAHQGYSGGSGTMVISNCYFTTDGFKYDEKYLCQKYKNLL